jgi:RNA polymerase sigma-70 factor (ECF subfamily)
MLKVKSGQVELLGLLYERYKKWLYNFFRQMSLDQEISEDLVQNVFMRILKYKHTYTNESKFVTWIFKIARNESYDYFNKNVKGKHFVALKEESGHSLLAADTDKEIETSQEHELLHKAINKLPYDKKEIIVLSKIKQLKYKEIGVILGCTETSARTRAHRALQDLKTTFFAMQMQ